MNCTQARKLFAAFWDDETTQAEREWLEGHFGSCDSCRREYEAYARTLELLGTLPRVEPAADLHDRVLQRVRRAESVPDRMPAARPMWVPIGSAVAAGALIALTLAGPWLGSQRDSRTATRSSASAPVTQPVLVHVPDARGQSPAGLPQATSSPELAAATDSLFDHSEDVEFILDPVTLHRGRASVTRSAGASRDERAVITF